MTKVSNPHAAVVHPLRIAVRALNAPADHKGLVHLLIAVVGQRAVLLVVVVAIAEMIVAVNAEVLVVDAIVHHADRFGILDQSGIRISIRNS
jgi:hypothetical protein